jgi:hypothetical protein
MAESQTATGVGETACMLVKAWGDSGTARLIAVNSQSDSPSPTRGARRKRGDVVQVSCGA